MNDLIDTTQMYLRSVVELEEEGVPAMRARIAERLEQSTPTVSQTVARMERDGLLCLGDARVLKLTEKGRAEGISVMRRHRLAECFLVEFLGMDLGEAHDEACRWEHVLSELAEERLALLLDSPSLSPYGCPIPGLEELGVHVSAPAFLAGVESLEVALEQGRTTAVVERLSENVQRDPAVLAEVIHAGVTPGAEISFEAVGGGMRLSTPSGAVVLPDGIAASVFVRSE